MNEDDAQITEQIVQSLLQQKANRIERGFYWENQIAFVYNSEKMEGNPLTKEQTRTLFETKTVSATSISPDHIQETRNHFRLFDRVLETYDQPLTKELIQEYHGILKGGTDDDLVHEEVVVGGWKTIPNGIGDIDTTPPSEVDAEIGKLLDAYNKRGSKSYRDIAGFHYFFECIHPFQDGNGRIGRAIAFKECLRTGLEPFIVLDEYKGQYYAGLRSFYENPDQLIGFFVEMKEIYMTEFASLMPEYLLLPKYRKVSQQQNYDEYFAQPKDAGRAHRSINSAKAAHKAEQEQALGSNRGNGRIER